MRKIIISVFVSLFLSLSVFPDPIIQDSTKIELSKCEKAIQEKRSLSIALIISEIALGIVTVITILK